MKKTNYHRKHLLYWEVIWQRFRKHHLGMISFFIILLFCLVGIYAPFLASSKPLMVYFDGHFYFPLFRYLFYKGFFTKYLDLFYNLSMFSLPLLVITWIVFRHHLKMLLRVLLLIIVFHFIVFLYLVYRKPQDPASDPILNEKRQKLVLKQFEQRQNPYVFSQHFITWNEELAYLNSYAKLNLVLRYQQRKSQHQKLLPYEKEYLAHSKFKGDPVYFIPTLWNLDEYREKQEKEQNIKAVKDNGSSYPQAKKLLTTLQSVCLSTFEDKPVIPSWLYCDLLFYSKENLAIIHKAQETVYAYEAAEARLKYLEDRKNWLEKQASQLRFEIMPLLRPFHWEDDAGGEQALNRVIPWWDLTRINRKDMIASLIFGIRISLSVGLLAVFIALAIGIPIGALAGFYGGKTDILIYRLIEVWEAMPTFFMLLMIVAFFQSKSIFLVIGVIGFFGWTGFSRYVRGEFLRQKQLPYVEACRSLGFNDGYIIFVHLLPNAIPPLLTLVPFAIMGAITSEAGLSFLGLGEESSSSWGVLMDEGRTAFPAESYLLWPPAILLTILLVAIALVGDTLRDALDPKSN